MLFYKMSIEDQESKMLLPHHEQQPLCTTRLPYRQGRKLTAVKVYTINNESAHLLVFGVPSLNIRQETKALFLKFGKLLLFNLTNEYPNEMFTETYHAFFERITCARIAKKMLDGKNFYGGFLHICYAPEFESVQELQNKLFHRKNDVLFRLKKNEDDLILLNSKSPDLNNLNIQNELIESLNVHHEIQNEITSAKKELLNDLKIANSEKLNMGELNTIYFGNKRKKKKSTEVVIDKKLKPNTEEHVEIVDCTNIEKETITNINESLINVGNEINKRLNYCTFGNEVIRNVPEKPLNKIKFHLGNNKNTS